MEENTETVRQAPPPDADGAGNVPPKEPAETPQANAPAKPDQPAVPKRSGSGAGVAIAATVIIVLALAAMATYAFIKTQN
jgi:uncharacterized protein HemX